MTKRSEKIGRTAITALVGTIAFLLGIISIGMVGSLPGLLVLAFGILVLLFGLAELAWNVWDELTPSGIVAALLGLTGAIAILGGNIGIGKDILGYVTSGFYIFSVLFFLVVALSLGGLRSLLGEMAKSVGQH